MNVAWVFIEHYLLYLLASYTMFIGVGCACVFIGLSVVRAYIYEHMLLNCVKKNVT